MKNITNIKIIAENDVGWKQMNHDDTLITQITILESSNKSDKAL